MSRGSPDFGATAPRELTTPALDSGELAARLGSPNVYDRLGTVLAQYQGDEPVGVIDEVILGSGRRENVLTSTPFGPWAWRLTTSDDGHRTGVRFRVPYIGDSPAGVEVVFRQVDSGNISPEASVIVDNATTRTKAGVRWNSSTSTWEHFNSSAAWAATPTQPQDAADNLWAVLKFAIDPTAQTYGRAAFDGVDLGLAGVAADNIGSLGRTMVVDVLNRAEIGSAVALDVAAVIITVNEV